MRRREQHASSKRCSLNVWAAFQIEIPREKLAIVSQSTQTIVFYTFRRNWHSEALGSLSLSVAKLYLE